jgi:hypothetical protein
LCANNTHVGRAGSSCLRTRSMRFQYGKKFFLKFCSENLVYKAYFFAPYFSQCGFENTKRRSVEGEIIPVVDFNINRGFIPTKWNAMSGPICVGGSTRVRIPALSFIGRR